MKNIFFSTLAEMRRYLSSSDTIEFRWKGIQPLLQDTDVAHQFWREINSAEWLSVLVKGNLFSSPPPVVRDSDGRLIRYFGWPASQYLAKIAPSTSENEAQIIADLFAGFSTDNPSVNNDMITAALHLPTRISSTLVPAITKAIEVEAIGFGFDKCCALCKRLATDEYRDDAIELARALFIIRHGDEENPNDKRDERALLLGLADLIPIMTEKFPTELNTILCESLKAATNVKRRFSESNEGDYSYLWRPAIEEHGANPPDNFLCDLTGFVRDAIKNSDLNLIAINALLQQYEGQIFQRLNLYFIREFADQNPELAVQKMLDKVLRDDDAFKHEYAQLMHDRWEMLSPKQRAEWLAQIEVDCDLIRAGLKWGDDYPLEVRVKQADWWKYERLYCIRDYLTGADAKFYEEMRAEKGEPELADLNYRMIAVKWGDESPIEIEKLADMPFEDVVDKVDSWPSDSQSSMGPNVNGLANIFGDYLSQRPEEFSSHAETMKNRQPIFVRTYIERMHQALKPERTINIDAVLALCDWVVDQNLNGGVGARYERDELEDNDWQWTREAISRFLKSFLQAESNNEPRFKIGQYRLQLWRIISALSKDDPKSTISHDSEKEDPRDQDYFTRAINSSRGKAVEAACEYARWVANQIKIQHEGVEIVERGFGSMPEFQKMLEWQIANENRSFEALAIIGSKFGLLNWIDRDWLRENVPKIFNLSEIETNPAKAYGWGAWNAFIVWVNPHREFYKLLTNEFAYAVVQSAMMASDERTRERPMNRLGEHLVILYGRGNLESDEGRSLWQRFLTVAAASIRLYVVGFVGFMFRDGESVPEEIINRLVALWEFYWQRNGRSDVESQGGKYLFGRWFACGQFPPAWSLRQLEDYLEYVPVPVPEPDEDVVEQLAKCADVDLGTVLSILDKMIRQSTDAWQIDDWRESAKSILAKARKDNLLRDKADELIDHLGRLGYLEFGELLTEEATA